MLRYIAIVWNPSVPEQTRLAQLAQERLTSSREHWEATLSTSGTYVAFVPAREATRRVRPICGDRGVILGSLFPRSSEGRAVGALSASQSDDIIDSEARNLTRDFWGSYVAILSRTAHSTLILRGPMSPLACFRCTVDGVHFFFSEVRDFAGLELIELTINWDCIRAQVANGDYLNSETALREVSSLDAGECCVVDGNNLSLQTYWHPHSFIERDPVDDFEVAAHALRETTQKCVDAWCTEHDSILLKLSGGLDSSIVLDCLVRAPTKPKITCVTYYSRGCGDERRFARSAAEKASVELIELRRNESLDLRRFTTCSLTARPVLNFSGPDIDPRNNALANEIGATAICDGELGDNLFGQSIGPAVLFEYTQRRSWLRGFLTLVLDFAQLHRESVWRTLRVALRERRAFLENPFLSSYLDAKRVHDIDFDSAWLVSRRAREQYESMLPRFIHPWLRNVSSTGAGKLELLYGLIMVTSTSFHPPFAAASDPERMMPLTSQPLVELALTIPSYHCIAHGQDRAVARHAFADRLPPMVLNRGTGKGGPDLWARDVLENNRPFLREFLLGGRLVEHQLLDPAKVETMLSGQLTKSTPYLCDVFVQLYIEAWIRNWEQRDQVRAAA